MICPLCQHRFEEAEMPCNTGCPMHRACKVLCCPRCHYEFVEESMIVNFVKRLMRRGAGAKSEGSVVQSLPDTRFVDDAPFTLRGRRPDGEVHRDEVHKSWAVDKARRLT